MIVILDSKGFFGKEVNILNKIEKKILLSILEKEKTLSEISKELNVSEQLLYYYINKSLKQFVEKIKKHNKVYYKAYKSYVILISEKEDFIVQHSNKKDFKPFIENGILNSIVVVGSPDPHGPFSARARDIHYVGFLMSHIGKFFNYTKYRDYIRLDTDIIKENLFRENLIVIGGPVTNMITYKLNTILRVRFLQEYNWDLYSDFTNRKYSDELVGLIACIKNPWCENKKVLVFAGKRAIGTKLAVYYFIEKEFSLLKDFYIIVQGVDEDGDGRPEKIYVLEENYL